MVEVEAPAPVVVEYDPITGVPAEFNEYLPKDSDEFKRWKASQEASTPEAAAEGLGGLTLDGQPKPVAWGGAAAKTAEKLLGSEVAQKLPGGKSKKKKAQEVVLERATRNKKKAVTTISGLDLFGVKLSEASKLFGKKFASGASIVKNAEGKEQIDVQGDFLDQAAALIVKTYKDVPKDAIFAIESKKKVPYFQDDDQ